MIDLAAQFASLRMAVRRVAALASVAVTECDSVDWRETADPMQVGRVSCMIEAVANAATTMLAEIDQFAGVDQLQPVTADQRPIEPEPAVGRARSRRRKV
jgi:hypothetical protein